MNQWTISGKLGHAPKLRALPSGDPVVNLNVAVHRRVKKDGEWTTDTIWTDVTLFGRNAKWLCDNLDKGSTIIATGELGLRTYTARDGSVKTQVELFAHSVEALDARPNGASQPRPQGSSQGGSGYRVQAEDPFPDDGDQLPF